MPRFQVVLRGLAAEARIEPARLVQFMRFLRDAGLMTPAAPGRHDYEVPAEDVAWLLVGILAGDSARASGAAARSWSPLARRLAELLDSLDGNPFGEAASVDSVSLDRTSLVATIRYRNRPSDIFSPAADQVRVGPDLVQVPGTAGGREPTGFSVVATISGALLGALAIDLHEEETPNDE